MRLPAATAADDFLGSDRLAQAAGAPGAPPPAAVASKPKTGGRKANMPAATAAGVAGAGGKGQKGAAAAGAAGGAAGEEVKVYPEPSLAQARQAVVASCILPLGAHQPLAK